MKRRVALWIVPAAASAAAVVAALPAVTGTIDALAQFDMIPSRAQLDRHLGADALDHVAELIGAPSTDFGVRLRAIRALALFCVPAGCAGEVPHQLARAQLEGGTSIVDGREILRQRAAIEALGVMRSGDAGDVATLVPFLDAASRDLRAAAAVALANLCDVRAGPALRGRYDVEQVAQVQVAISDALRVLESCAP